MGWWLLALPVLAWLGILLWFAGPARAAWREPVLRHPVLVIESDDWGPGPAHHGEALAQLANTLARFRDTAGRPPVLTLGLTLSLPDGEAIAASGFTRYHARSLEDPAYAPVLAAIRAGISARVFWPQLHGMAHYWPEALMAAARQDDALRAWITQGPGQETEALPSPLQSRWVDASVLPSRPLPEGQIQTAVQEEVEAYAHIFGERPEVVVPPTFVWTPVVEAAWASQGVAGIVTPGQRCVGRDGAGKPQCLGPRFHNGQAGIGGLVYLVRDRYFEPARGHRADQALAALAQKTAQGRPCLLETHRFNFTGPHQAAALTGLETLLAQALARFPDLGFISPAELTRNYQRGTGFRTGLMDRIAAWRARMAEVPRFDRLARLTGLALVLAPFRLPTEAGS